MKNLLFAVKNMNVGGVEKSLLSLLNTLDPAEYAVDLLLLEEYGGFMGAIPGWVNVIICEDYANIKDEVNCPPLEVMKMHLKSGHRGRAAELLPAYLIAKATENDIFYYKAVFRKVKKLPKHYDAAIAYTSMIHYLTWFVDFCVDADVYIGWIHFDVSKIRQNSKTFLYLHKKMKKIYVVSQSALDAFTEKYPQLKNKSELCYNVIDKSQILSLAEAPAEEIRQPGVKTIVTLGRLAADKGQDIIPKVAARLKEAGVPFRWYLIGDGGLRKQIEKEVKDLGVDHEVILMGTRTNPYPFLNQADLYVQTSIHEGFCITLGEAKVFGMPIISTEFAGAHEQLDDRPDCTVVKRSEEALYAKIMETLR